MGWGEVSYFPMRYREIEFFSARGSIFLRGNNFFRVPGCTNGWGEDREREGTRGGGGKEEEGAERSRVEIGRQGLHSGMYEVFWKFYSTSDPPPQTRESLSGSQSHFSFFFSFGQIVLFFFLCPSEHQLTYDRSWGLSLTCSFRSSDLTNRVRSQFSPQQGYCHAKKITHNHAPTHISFLCLCW